MPGPWVAVLRAICSGCLLGVGLRAGLVWSLQCLAERQGEERASPRTGSGDHIAVISGGQSD